MKWEGYPNLRKKPPAPAKNRGRVQRAIKRAFIASGAEVLSSAQIYSWTHPRLRLGRRKTMPFGIYWGTLQALRRICDPVGRSDRVSGAPILWRLRNSAGPQTSPVLPGADGKQNQ
jgi:hypothetical protein